MDMEPPDGKEKELERPPIGRSWLGGKAPGIVYILSHVAGSYLSGSVYLSLFLPFLSFHRFLVIAGVFFFLRSWRRRFSFGRYSCGAPAGSSFQPSYRLCSQHSLRGQF